MVLEERFSPPLGSSLRKLLGNAWGIWTSDHPVEVVLRFTQRVAARVSATTWHDSEEVRKIAGGEYTNIALTDREIRASKPGKTIAKLSDGGGLQLWQDVCSFTCSLCLTHFTALKVRGGDLGIRDNATLWILNCAGNSASVALAEGRRPGAREQRD